VELSKASQAVDNYPNYNFSLDEDVLILEPITAGSFAIIQERENAGAKDDGLLNQLGLKYHVDREQRSGEVAYQVN
jgi:hypothetical protein